MRLATILLLSLLSISTHSMERFAQWEADGPGGKEHGLTWIFENTYYLANGWGFEPFQGTASNELWSLDLETKQWNQLPILGDAAGPDGRSAPLAQGNGILVLSQESAFFGQAAISQLSKLEVANGVGVWSKLTLAGPGARDFLTRSSRLTSLVYYPAQDLYYTICNTADCRVFAIKLAENNSAIVAERPVNGEAPAGRVGHAFGLDEASGTFVVVGGQSAIEGQAVFFDEAWTLDLSQQELVWKKLAEAPEGRRNPCFVFHQDKRQLLLWGGTRDGRTAIPGLTRLTLGEETALAQEEVQPAGQMRSSCMGTYDTSQKRAFMGFGNAMDGENQLLVFRDLWQL